MNDIYYLPCPDGGHSEIDSYCEYCNNEYTEIKKRKIKIDDKLTIINDLFCGKCNRFRPDKVVIEIERTNKMMNRHIRLMSGVPKKQIDELVDDEYVEWLQKKTGKSKEK